MTKHIRTFVLFIAMAVAAQAQQLPQYSQYLHNAFVFNPATAGASGSPEFKLVMRSQWTGLKDLSANQQISTFSINAPLREGKVGLGGYVFKDEFGPVSKTGISGTYAYHINLNSSSKLSFGLSGSMYLYKLNTDALIFDIYENTDNVLTTPGNFKAYTPNLGFGTYYTGEKLFLGLSVPEMIPARITSSQNADFFIMQVKQHYFLMGGTMLKLSDDVTMKPSMMLKIVKGAPTQADVNVMFDLKRSFYVGGSYRTNDAVVLMFGINLKDMWRLGYSYDMITSNLKQYAKSSHELMISYNLFKKGKKEDAPSKENSDQQQTPPPDNEQK
ncbi:MAG: type IX secretion system membrane protein PorP/SprF [Bacteroidota bacterium]